MKRADFPVVALVCSAGGLAALTRVLAPLPADFPAALLILQHHWPESKTRLGTILARTMLPVTTARESDALVPAHVLVAPSGQHTLITPQGTVALIESGPAPPYRPSADLVLTTLALAVDSRAVAVILSGHGIDGATGATAIHHFGGVVVASDEASSTAFSMPHTTIVRDEITDYVAALDPVTNTQQSLPDATEVGSGAARTSLSWWA